MKTKIQIVEDTVTEYLDKLQKLSADPSNKTRFLKSAASEMHFEYVEPLMPKWNPNLMYSPLEKKNQVINVSDTVSSIELIYTGYTEEESYGLEKVYSEFAEGGNPQSGHLARDYAYYQETGQDPIAEDFGGHHYVGLGTLMYQSKYYSTVLYYLDDLMNLKAHQNRSFVDLYDYQVG